MAEHTLDIAAFRVQFPAFANATAYPDPFLQQCWDVSTCYIHSNDYGALRDAVLQQCLDLMTAHIATISTAAGSGKSTGLLSASTIGDVSVTVVQPPIKSQFQFWLLQTPYGVQLLALLGVKAAGGLYVGGLAERTGFRKIGGVFI